MMDMQKGYAHQFFDFITYIKNCNKEQRTQKVRLLEPNQNMWGVLNPNSMKNHRTLPNCSTSSLTEPRPTQTHSNPQNQLCQQLAILQKNQVLLDQIVVTIYQKFFYFQILFEIKIWLVIGTWIIKPILHNSDDPFHVAHLQCLRAIYTPNKILKIIFAYKICLFNCKYIYI